MCGIFAYKGISQNASNIVLSGLKKLDYRGYDSWGIAVLKDSKIFIEKDVGKIENVNNANLPLGNLALGHTRWATTGAVTKVNAHPHFSTDKSFALVQNGIVENFLELKFELINKGYRFESETDTEVIVRLIEDYQKQTSNLLDAVKKAFIELKGRNTIALIDLANQRIIAARNGSPLIIGKKDNDYYLSSDTFSIADKVCEYCDINNLEMLIIDANPKIINLKTGKTSKISFKKVDFKSTFSEKGQFKHFMIKEIFETPYVLRQVIKTDKNNLNKLIEAIRSSKTIYAIGSGTAGNAAAQIAYYLREFASINAISLVGADAQEYYKLFSEKDLIIAPSQSGETADVLEVLEFAKNKGVKIATYVNMPGSMMTRISDFKFMAEAGPEICVMSTKIFVSQIAWGYLLAQSLAKKYDEALIELNLLADTVENYLNNKVNHQEIIEIAQKLLGVRDIFILGKSQNSQIAREAMVKLVEGTYKHAHAIPAGDLKHYAITLVEKDVHVICIFSPDDTVNDMNNAVSEIRSRGGTIIGVFEQNQSNFDYFLKTPKNIGKISSVFNIIPLQLLTYYLADMLGNNIDKPRNIAKSVTVK